MATVSERVQNVVAEVQQLTKLPDPKQRLLEDLGLDKLEKEELRMGLEQEFGSNLPEDVFSQFTTVAQLIEWAKDRAR